MEEDQLPSASVLCLSKTLGWMVASTCWKTLVIPTSPLLLKDIIIQCAEMRRRRKHLLLLRDHCDRANYIGKTVPWKYIKKSIHRVFYMEQKNKLQVRRENTGKQFKGIPRPFDRSPLRRSPRSIPIDKQSPKTI